MSGNLAYVSTALNVPVLEEGRHTIITMRPSPNIDIIMQSSVKGWMIKETKNTAVRFPGCDKIVARREPTLIDVQGCGEVGEEPLAESMAGELEGFDGLDVVLD